MNHASIPASYEQWRHFTEVSCQITLTPNYINNRWSALQNNSDAQTREFVTCYGSDQHQRIIAWFRRALDES